jgi:dimeric dUTPase (all-alpha-NTP-PPase superfamily)
VHGRATIGEPPPSGKWQFRGGPAPRHPLLRVWKQVAYYVTCLSGWRGATAGHKAACHGQLPGASVAGMDKLEEIFRMQDTLNRRIGVALPPPSDEEKAKWILNYTRAMQQETAELIDSVPWKWWAKYQKFDEQNAKVEVVDLFHFLVSLAQTLGMTADDVYQAYLKKNQVNHERQDRGYAQKDEADSKHI